MRKVLLITYYWPPAGGPGVQRWLKFVTHLPEYGVQPVLFVPENPTYPFTDDSLLHELPEGITIYRGKIREPLRWASWMFGKKSRKMSAGQLPGKEAGLVSKFLLWIRANLFVPDARVFWVKPSAVSVKAILQKENIDTLITTGPPHSVHLIALLLKKEMPFTWVADFRDPWTRIGYHADLPMTRAVKRRHASLEKQVLQTADTVIATSRTTAAEFEQIRGKEVKVVTNGYDARKYAQVDVPLDKNFTLSHIGSLLKDRNPEPLWRAISELRASDPGFSSDFRLKLAGSISDTVRQSVRQFGLEDCTEYLGYVQHARALALQKSSQVLLLLEIDREETRGIIPGKLFEYLASGRPVVALGPKQWEAGEILQETGNGRYFTYLEKEAMQKHLLHLYHTYKKGGLISSTASTEAYSRKVLTGKLAKLL